MTASPPPRGRTDDRWRRARGPALVALVATAALLTVGAAAGRPNWPVYAVVTGVGALAAAAAHRRVGFSTATLWGLTAFAVGHLAGGMVPVGASTLYGVWLLDGVVRYDNLQHAVGFGAVGRALWEAVRRSLAPVEPRLPTVAAWIVVLGAGAAGAVNEVVEWVMTLTLPGTDVGGYDNTARDLVANLVGGVVAAGLTRWELTRAAAGGGVTASGRGRGPAGTATRARPRRPSSRGRPRSRR